MVTPKGEGANPKTGHAARCLLPQSLAPDRISLIVCSTTHCNSARTHHEHHPRTERRAGPWQ